MRYGFICIILCFPGFVSPELQAQRAHGERCMLWYNVENLFFPGSDSTSVDLDFTPEGSRHWTYTRYRLKLTALAKVILAAGEWDVPDLVGLCEVEGAKVLEDLCAHPLLKKYSYAYLHSDSPDHRGMDVACLYRTSVIGIRQWRTFPSPVSLDGTRDLFHLSFTWGKSDTLELFLVHFVSKYRGAGATAESRRKQAAFLVRSMDSVHALRPANPLLLAGDFNDSPGSYSLKPLCSAPVGKDSLRLLAPKPSPHVEGSYKYRGRWLHLDQFYLCDPSESYEASASLLVLEPLLKLDEEYGGLKPRRTYYGFRYEGGISDHLPLVLRFFEK